MGSLNEVWLAKIKEFRGLKLGGSEQIDDNFMLDILEELCHENVSEYVKLQLLFALQEKVSSFSSDITSIECAVGSLKDMFLHPSGHPSQFFLSQILVTGTCLVVTSDLLIKSHEVFITFVGVLTDIIEKVNSSGNLLVRKTACECLWEIELNYPGILQSKLGHLYKMCEAESSPIFQSYMVLFVSVLRHTIEQLASNSFIELESDCLNRLLTDYSEPLKPLTFPSEVITSDLFPLALRSPPCGIPLSYLPEKLNTKELKRAVSFTMENIGLLNTTALFYAMLELMHCIKLSELSPNTFKSQFIQWISSSDISISHMLLFLRLKFSIDMFQEGDDILLLQRLFILASQPTLPNDYRLLCFKWLMHFPEELCKTGHAPSEPAVSSFFFEDVHHFYPSGFDSLDIVQDKLKLLCLFFWSNEEDSVDTDTLMNCLSLINKQVLLGIGGNRICALFRTLFWYYNYFHNTALVQDIYRLIVSIITKHPKFMAHVVDFLDSIALVTPDSPFPVDLLRVLSQHVVAQPLSAVLPNLRHHLKLLAQAMTKSNIDPSSTVRFLDLLLHTSELSNQGDWSLGNCVLAVCHSILLHHDTRHVIRDLGNLLLNMSTTYQDIDIRDRSRFYYSLLANVSSEKATKILMTETTKKQNFNVGLADDITSSSFSTAPPVYDVKTPFLQLTRVPKNVEPERNEREVVSSLDLQPYGLLGHYSKMVNDSSWNPDIQIEYYVHFNDLEPPPRLYALVLQFGRNKNYEAVKDVHIPFLSQSTSAKPQEGCHQIKVVFKPREPVPACFSVRAVFHNEDGHTCTMVLEQLQIRFEDLFLPLSLPEMFQNENANKTKKKLFVVLWEDFTEKQRTKEAPLNKGALSVICLSLPWQRAQEILNEHFQQYIIEAEDEEFHVGIFLPPRQHLLLKFISRNDKTFVSVAMDDWRILRLVESYLRELETMHK